MGHSTTKRAKRPGYDFVLLSSIFLVHVLIVKASILGSCYRLRYTSTKACGQLLRSAISREQCCTAHYRRAWSPSVTPTSSQGHRSQGHSPHNSSFGLQSHPLLRNKESHGDSSDTDLEIRHHRHFGQDCQLCNKSCQDVRCSEDKKCLLRHGIPKCVCNPQCHLKHKPVVCGTDGRTYRSECQLLKRSCRKKKRILVAHSGPCQTCNGVRCGSKRSCVLDEVLTPRCMKCSKPCPETTRRRSICGTDGITYSSRCLMRNASCETGNMVKKAYKGPCKEGATCHMVKCWRGEDCLHDFVTNQPHCLWCGDARDCSSSPTHICASDKKTYQSWCSLHHASCGTKKFLRVIPYSNCTENSTRRRKNKKCQQKTKRNHSFRNKTSDSHQNRKNVDQVENNFTEVEPTKSKSLPSRKFKEKKQKNSRGRMKARKGKKSKKKKKKDC